MRTTLTLDDDALELIRNEADLRRISLGAAASDLIRHGSRYELQVKQVNGLPVFDVPADFPRITDEMVSQFLDEG